METDKELLELAAKAAGIEVHAALKNGIHTPIGSAGAIYVWNPLESDKDALRLAVKLGMDICFGANYCIVRGSEQMPLVNNANDPYAATRRAITRAAAAIGKEKSLALPTTELRDGAKMP